MNYSTQLNYANIINDGMEKQALSQAVGRGLGHVANAGKGFANFMTKKRQMPFAGAMSRVGQGYRDVTGKGVTATNLATPRFAPPSVGQSAYSFPYNGNVRLTPNMMRPVTREGGFHPINQDFRPGRSARPAAAQMPANPKYLNFKAPGTGKGIPGYAASGRISPDEMAGMRQRTEEATRNTRAQAYSESKTAPSSLLDRARQQWSQASTLGKAGIGYGGVTAATAPFNYANNAKADWQEQHPIMSMLGRTFAGMPEYNRHTYLLPSFIQR